VVFSAGRYIELDSIGQCGFSFIPITGLHAIVHCSKARHESEQKPMKRIVGPIK
jgi:hypothetical protein